MNPTATEAPTQITFPTTRGQVMPKLMLCAICLAVIFNGVHRNWFASLNAYPLVFATILSFAFILCSERVWVMAANPKVIRLESRVFERCVRSKSYDASSFRWVRTRWTGSSVILELSTGNSWDCVTLQQIFLAKGQTRETFADDLNRLREQVAKVLGVEDRGWETWPTAKPRPA